MKTKFYEEGLGGVAAVEGGEELLHSRESDKGEDLVGEGVVLLGGTT